MAWTPKTRSDGSDGPTSHGEADSKEEHGGGALSNDDGFLVRTSGDGSDTSGEGQGGGMRERIRSLMAEEARGDLAFFFFLIILF